MHIDDNLMMLSIKEQESGTMKNKTGIFMGFGLAILMWIMWRLQKSCELGFEAIELVTESVRKMTPQERET